MDKLDREIDDLIDNFEIKPITQGLGFHHSLKEKKDIALNLKKQSELLKDEIKTRARQLERSALKQQEKSAVNMGELAPFYDTPSKKSTENIVSLNIDSNERANKKKVKKIQTSHKQVPLEASLSMKLIAWIIDVTLITIMLAIICVATIVFTGLSTQNIQNLIAQKELLISFSSLGLMFYLFYFSFFDKTEYSTPGKNILHLKLHSLKGRLSLVQSFMRTCLGLVSLLFLGLPLLFKLHDRMAQTQVVEKN